MVPAAQAASLCLPTHPGLVPEVVCCLKYEHTVGSDNGVRFTNRDLQVQPEGGQAELRSSPSAVA